MKHTITIIAALFLGMSVLGCAEEVAHRESDRPNITGGRTHKSETVTQNPDGSLNKSETKTKY